MADKQDYSVRIRRVADYEENADNPVSHPVANLRAVLDSVSKVGAARSGVASKGKKLLAGNLTKQAMLEAGIEEVIEITTNGKQWVIVNRDDLTPEQEQYYSVADERSSEMAEWNVVQLAEIVNLLKDTPLDTTALFDDTQIAVILGQAVAYGDTSTDRKDNVASTWDMVRNGIGRKDTVHVTIGNFESHLPGDVVEMMVAFLTAQYEDFAVPMAESLEAIIVAGVRAVETGDH